MNALNKYLAPILQFILACAGTIQLFGLDNQFTALETWSLVAFMIAPALTYLVPLSGGPWPGLLKTGLNTALGGVLVIVSVLERGAFVWDFATLSLVGIAVMNALAVEIGVAVRLTQTAREVANPDVDNAVPARADTNAFAIVTHNGH
jgi:hypothetical protein